MRYKPEIKPYPHQSRAALAAIRQGNHAFLMDPGTGKTKAALDAIVCQHLRGVVNRVIILTPISGIEVWKDEIRANVPIELRKKITFTILNHDKLSVRRRQSNKSYVYPYVQGLIKKNADLVVVDESHRYKRAGAVRAQSLWRFVDGERRKRGNGRPYVYLLTGTPNAKGYIDLFAQYRIMDPAIFGTSKAGFEDLYCQYGFGKRRYQIVKYLRREELVRKIRTHATIVSDDVLNLPQRVWQNVKVPLPSDVWDMYNEMAEEMLLELEGGELVATTPAVLRQRLLQITGGFTTNGQQLHDTKLRYLRELARDLYEKGEQLIVYARYLSEVNRITRELDSLGYAASDIQGSTKHHVRAGLVRAFQKGSKHTLQALVFQVDTGSLAITLTAGREVIFYSLPDSWSTYYQATKRVHRIGQGRSVRYRHLVCPNTVDMSVLRILRGRADMHAELMGNPRKFIFGG